MTKQIKDWSKDFDERFHDNCWNDGEYDKTAVKDFIQEQIDKVEKECEDTLKTMNETYNQQIKIDIDKIREEGMIKGISERAAQDVEITWGEEANKIRLEERQRILEIIEGMKREHPEVFAGVCQECQEVCNDCKCDCEIKIRVHNQALDKIKSKLN